MSDRNVPIAIVGMAALLPEAPDLATYWRNIVDARDCLTDIPEDHSWSPKDYYDADPATPDKTWATRGGFIGKVPFDPMDHGVIPVALEAIDTDQLLALIVARECLADAGMDPDGGTWDRDRTSIILGHTSTNELVVDLSARLHHPTWRKAMARQGVPESVIDKVVDDIAAFYPTWQEQSFPGMLANVSAGRIANRLDLGGTNASVDAACASSLAAIHYAVADLQAGRADVAISGGTDTLNDIFMYMCFSKTPALSRQGDARPFSSDSDGIVISEGIAMFALKRLADAERDGDRIYAVIQGIGTSSDGRNKSIYAPSSSGQVKAVRRAYDEAGFDLESVELIEAHGTGTKAGDLAEFNGLREIFRHSTRDEKHVAMGSVKSQIGHTKATAGAAGLMKVALALHQRVIPPTAKITAPNPRMDFDGTPLYLSTEARPWVHAGDTPRRAGVSAFGFGGTNYHVAVEEYVPTDGSDVWLPATHALFLLGGESDQDLLEAIEAASTLDAPSVHHASHAVLERWTPGARVVGFLAEDLDGLRAALGTARELVGEGSPATRDGVRYAHPTSEQARLGVIFPGQGSQYVGMGRTAALRHPALRQTLDRAEQALRDAGRGSLFQRISPPPAWSKEQKKAQQAALTATEWAQPALGAVELGLWNTLSGFGVRPAALAGHSYGELVALHVGGAYDEATLWTLSRVRGEAMRSDDSTDRGTMAAVRGELDRVAGLVDDVDDVVLANRNHPTQAVLAGTREGIRRALEVVGEAGLSGREIPVSAAFHSPLVADAREPLAQALQTAQVQAPSVPVRANVTGTVYPQQADEVRRLLADQVVSGVDWVGVVQDMVDDGIRTFVECGPKTVLSGLVKRCTKGVDGIEIISLDDGGRTDGDVLLKQALLSLACRGVAVDEAPILAERLPRRPREAGSKATVWVGGANVKRPDTLNPPEPETLAWSQPVRPPSRAAEQPRVHADGSVDAPRRRRAPSPIPTSDTAGPPLFTAPQRSSDAEGAGGSTGSGARASGTDAEERSGQPAPGAAAVSGAALGSLLQATRESLQAFQQTQARTADVHQAFLEGHAKAQESFAELIRAHTSLLQRAAGGQVDLSGIELPAAPAAPTTAPSSTGASAPAPSQPRTPIGAYAADHDTLSDAIIRPTALKATTLDMPRNDGPHIAAGDDLPPMLSARALSDLVKGGGALPATVASPAPASSPAPVLDRPDARAVLLETVADKTGYPVDLLDLGMDLESDLGVDSIKRVEILSAVQESLPGIAPIPDDELAALRTLGDVAERLDQALGPAGTVAPTSTPAAPETPSVPPATASSTADVAGVVMDVVAEKTGFPADLLGVAMDLESDLGIDSIKRVEILSAVQERIAGLPELPDDELASLRTLGDIIDRLEQALGGATPAAPAEPAAESSPDVDVQGALMSVVADKTGYPVDLLEPGMDLESDLGIDSIKRVEILSALQEAVPSLPDLPEDDLAAARTLGDIAELANAHAGGAAPAPAAPDASPAPQATQAPVGPVRREVVVVPAPEGAGATVSGTLVLTRDRLGLADRLAAALREHGVNVEIIDPDWSSAEYVRDALPGDVGAVVHLAALGAMDTDLERRVRGAFLLAKAVPQVGLFAVISGLGGTFGHDSLAGPPLQGALAGLAKTVAQEWSSTRALAVDIDPDLVDAQALAEELLTERGVVEVGLAEEPITLDAVEVVLSDADADADGTGEAPVSPGDLVVVTGGARGVTARVAIEIARRWRPTLLLLGRSAVPGADPEWAEGVDDEGLKAARIAQLRTQGAPFDPRRLERELASVRKAREIRATLDAIDATGARVHYAVADVTDAKAVAAAVRTTMTQAGPVRGIVHGAGVIADKLITEKDPADAWRVLDTKIKGLDHVLAAADVTQLKLVAVFSSVAGRYGNRGQSDYAMANEAITHVAHALRHRGVPHVKALHWGPWAGGMVTPTLAAAFQARGLSLVGLDEGADAFCDELERGGDAVEVVVGGPDSPGGLMGVPAGVSQERRLSGEEAVAFDGRETFLEDHRIDGKPVLPFVMAMETMAAAARRACPDLRFVGVRDVAVLKGIVLDADQGADLTLRWKPVEPGPGAEVALAFELLGAKNKIGLPTVHYKGTVDLGARGPAGARFPGSNGLSKQAYPYAVSEAYDRFLFHGPGFQGIESIRGHSDHGIVGTLASSRPKRLGVDAATWTTDPVTLDSALQLVGLWVREHKGASALPTYVERYTQVAPFRGQVDVHIEFEPTRTARGSFRATFVDEGGRVVATVDGGQYTAMAGLEERYR